MSNPLNFQSIILKLQDFWASRGSLIWQPYYAQVGAGTYNPATFLRVLGPEPWNVAYVEPSIRPDDGRYGENPNRMQMHYQFQVILKPDPGNPQEIYLESLQAIGIDPLQHDIRFVEDNWESPALGAWGLGWEVWCDGQEITQFTYFQQAGGIQLDPVSVEITYGLERIAIALQGVEGFQDIQWNETLTDGDVNLQAEEEHSRYYFEIADVVRLRQMYDLYEQEAQACLEKGLVLPAHDYLLKCSHTFNILDTRGAVGVTERQGLFARMRDVAKGVAQAYLDQRQRLEFPLLDKAQLLHPQMDDVSLTPQISPGPITDLPEKGAFLLEIGVEELPAGDLDSALYQLGVSVPALLAELRLAYQVLQVMGTPRRLVVVVEELASRQADLEQWIKGPPADKAFAPDGSPTKAVEGFARSKGISIADLEIREVEGGRYVGALVHQSGKSIVEVFAEALPKLIASIRFEKPMRWNPSNVLFSRPIRWLVAIFSHGEDCTIIPFEFAGLLSGCVTKGLRFRMPLEYCVHSPLEYFDFLSSQGIVLDSNSRQATVREQVAALANSAGGVVSNDPELFAEVTNLVEAPTALLGSFNPDYLKLPPEVLISVMKKHQRYFPVLSGKKVSAEEVPLPCFIAVRNGDNEGLDTVVEGNQHVIRARFADANFFVREDLKKPLEDYLPRLSTLTFQARLGTMRDKVTRIQALVEDLSQQVGLDNDQLRTARRAALLSKADLGTRMVVEMTSLQGQIGRYYALRSGEMREVAQAILDHYLPRHAGDQLPASRPGLVIGLADRLDTLAGLFSAGLIPSGNKDPFALRRHALGLVQILVSWDIDFNIDEGLCLAASHLPISSSTEILSACSNFVVERFRNILLDQGRRYDIVDAVLAVQGHNPAAASRGVAQLQIWTSRPDWHRILPAYARCVRITRDLEEQFEIESSLFAEQAERDLYHDLVQAEQLNPSSASVDQFLNTFLPIIPAIDRFFEQVLVMSEDHQMRQNRLGLLQRIALLAERVADLSRLEGF